MALTYKKAGFLVEVDTRSEIHSEFYMFIFPF